MLRKITLNHILLLGIFTCLLLLPGLANHGEHWYASDSCAWSTLDEVDSVSGSGPSFYPPSISSPSSGVVYTSVDALLAFFVFFSFLVVASCLSYSHFIRPPPLYHF